MRKLCVFLIAFLSINTYSDQVIQRIDIDLAEGNKEISPLIYGRNLALSSLLDENANFQDANVRFLRQTGGNNSSKYNWTTGQHSAPDWYNNVTNKNNWDISAQQINDQLDNVSAMYAFPATGWAAYNEAANFDFWTYDRSATRKKENLAGDGDISKYLKPWPADSAAGILNHWFGPGGLGLNKEKFRYWNIDNEPDIWDKTHDDVFTTPVHPDTVINRYLRVARKVKSLDPSIQLVGPGFTSEWHWWWYGKDQVGMSFMEYFVKKFGEASIADGIQLIDVIDFHHYPSFGDKTEFLQFHRVWFDTSYSFPQANGVKMSEGGWNNNLTKEYVFQRTEDWITQYFPNGNTVSLGISENGVNNNATPPPPIYAALWYASHLGTFADRGVKLFTPWHWYPGQWEVISLFSNYHYEQRVSSTSFNDSIVSAYSSINTAGDSLSIIFINRDEINSQSISYFLKNGKLDVSKNSTIRTLSNLPATETYVSISDNALVTSTKTISSESSDEVTLPALSITQISYPLVPTNTVSLSEKLTSQDWSILKTDQGYFINSSEVGTVQLFNFRGEVLETHENFKSGLIANQFNKGIYFLVWNSATNQSTTKLLIN